jgi:outer membrane protein assembly factor BamD
MYLKMFGKIMRLRVVIFALLLLWLFSGCSFFNKHEMVDGSPEGLYSRGAVEFQKSNYKKSREYFLQLKEKYPLHNMAILAEMGIADSYYSDKEYAEAENAYNDFISLHPTNENVPYAFYQVGMCHYNQIGSIDRDQTEAIKAGKELERLVTRFPESKFSTMAGKLIRECKQKMAEHEFYIGQFYFRQNKYQAALARFEKVARDYANVGLDYKIEYFINETKIKIVEEERLKKVEEEKLKKEVEEKRKTAKK